MEIQENRITAKLLPVGDVYVYGNEKMEITPELLKQIKENFEKGYPHYKPFLNIDHVVNEKFGDIVGVEVKEDGLYVEIELNEEGTKLIKDKKYEYLSAELDMAYVDRKTGDIIGPVLLGAALTNRPAMPELKPLSIAAFNELLVKVWKGFAKLFADKKTYKGLVLEPDKDWNWDWTKDANKIIETDGWKGLAKVCLYVDTENFEKGESGYPENKQAYYFPFAKLEDDGKYHAYFKALLTAMAYLNGARKGVKLSASAKKQVYKEIAEWYEAFDKEVPELKLNEEVQNMEELKDLREKYEALMKEKEDLERKFKEVSEELQTMKQKAFNEQIKQWKEKMVSNGVLPAAVEKAVVLLSENKITFEEAEELLSFNKKEELTKQFTDDKSDKTKIDKTVEIAKVRGWKVE